MQVRRGLDGAGRVVRQQRRDFQRDPAVGTSARIEGRSKQVGGAGQILQREFEEQVFT